MSRSYIPEPQPQFGSVELSAFYYPGTEQVAEWDQVEQTTPERKPLLGWYDESNPEVIDWQIKWAVEHGISSFCLDWYWNKGFQRLDHWVKGYYKASFRRYLKWYMMWCNHNEPGSHSTADQIAVTRFWIENYFKTPEYYTVDGKPAVVIWSINNLDKDFIAEAAGQGQQLQPGEGAGKALELSDNMAKEAGLPGIHFINMYQGGEFNPETVIFGEKTGCRDTVFYNLDLRSVKLAPEFKRPGDTDQKFHYDCVVNGSPVWWQKSNADPAHPTIPMITTGWDDRPRSFQYSRVVYGRTPEKFRQLCLACRKFCEEKNIRKVMLAPINEWQEGTYIEPNHEFGFGFYDALRDVFSPRPAAGFPENLTPEKVGLGPYDFPPMERPAFTAWDFSKGVSGWYRNPFGTAVLQIKEDALVFSRTYTAHPALRTRLTPFAAGKFKRFKIRMMIEPNPKVEPIPSPALALFWGSTGKPIITPELTFHGTCKETVPVFPDNQWHEYTIDLESNPEWNGEINELWLDPIPLSSAVVRISWMYFE